MLLLSQGIFLAGWRKSETAYSLFFLSSHVTHLIPGKVWLA